MWPKRSSTCFQLPSSASCPHFFVRIRFFDGKEEWGVEFAPLAFGNCFFVFQDDGAALLVVLYEVVQMLPQLGLLLQILQSVGKCIMDPFGFAGGTFSFLWTTGWFSLCSSATSATVSTVGWFSLVPSWFSLGIAAGARRCKRRCRQWRWRTGMTMIRQFRCLSCVALWGCRGPK